MQKKSFRSCDVVSLKGLKYYSWCVVGGSWSDVVWHHIHLIDKWYQGISLQWKWLISYSADILSSPPYEKDIDPGKRWCLPEKMVKNLNCSTTLKGNSYLQKEWMDKTLWLQENRSKISSRNLRDICCLVIIYIISTVKDLAKYLFFLHPSTVSTTYMTHYKIWHTYPWSIYHILTSACLSYIYIEKRWKQTDIHAYSIKEAIYALAWKVMICPESCVCIHSRRL